MAAYNATHEDKLGWVNQANIRGTMDIIWSCLLVVFTSTWTVLHLNVPAEDESCWQVLLRKSRWCICIVLAPEALTGVASLQMEGARESVPPMHEIGVSHWTNVHGFFAESGGFLLCPPDIRPFPVNSRAMHYLISKRYLEAPSTTKKEIWDRSKSDKFAKGVALVQGSYLVCQSIARLIQSLDMSCLEIVTLAFVLCTATTLYYWWEKPIGVESPIRLECATPIASIVKESGEGIASLFWSDTPMDFVEKPGWYVWRRRTIFKDFGKSQTLPIQRIPNDYGTDVTSLKIWSPVALVCIANNAIHLCAWNYNFPTSVERLLWRITSSFLVAVMVFASAVFLIAFKPGVDIRVVWFGFEVRETRRTTREGPIRRLITDIIPNTSLAVLYFAARLMVLGLTLAGLRVMPASVFQTINWTQFWPHL